MNIAYGQYNYCYVKVNNKYEKYYYCVNVANEQETLLQCECCLQAGEIILLYEYVHPVNMTKERKDTVKWTWI
jgi:hypothetical protein